jgi:hypothetical protein
MFFRVFRVIFAAFAYGSWFPGPYEPATFIRSISTDPTVLAP